MIAVFLVVGVVVVAGEHAQSPARHMSRAVKNSGLVTYLAIKVQIPSVSGAYMSPALCHVNGVRLMRPRTHRLVCASSPEPELADRALKPETESTANFLVQGFHFLRRIAAYVIFEWHRRFQA